ncbi:Zn-ribbon containing protein [Peptacetobacter sp.]|uniref:Zn-ribbon containing protein n=1 Tax=Peptacetobacter sp. TaxID=2991975 RepID=UPI0026083950|nr:Zn-ribbon containing protein [Peptacetobacter sp.]
MLIRCTECNSFVSEEAKSCPKCGCPISIIIENIEKNKADNEKKEVELNSHSENINKNEDREEHVNMTYETKSENTNINKDNYRINEINDYADKIYSIGLKKIGFILGICEIGISFMIMLTIAEYSRPSAIVIFLIGCLMGILIIQVFNAIETLVVNSNKQVLLLNSILDKIKEK